MSDGPRDFRFPAPAPADQQERLADAAVASEPTSEPAEAPRPSDALTEASPRDLQPEPGHQFEPAPAKKAPAKKRASKK